MIFRLQQEEVIANLETDLSESHKNKDSMQKAVSVELPPRLSQADAPSRSISYGLLVAKHKSCRTRLMRSKSSATISLGKQTLQISTSKSSKLAMIYRRRTLICVKSYKTSVKTSRPPRKLDSR